MPAGKYGPSVIGDEQYEKEALQGPPGATTKFGPAVTGEGEPAEDEESEYDDELPPGYSMEGGQGGYYTLKDPDGEVVDGPTQTGKWPVQEVYNGAAMDYERRVRQQEADEGGSSDRQLSLDELRAVLADQPETVDEMMHAEFDRPDGPRPEALEIIRDAEADRETPREEVLATLAGAIGPVATEPEPEEDEGTEGA